mmetsp:Transcript_71687/g.116218  ORF Transcript_71687/g.116218 Transcript_71687/m.116218 type:complete len:112 (+) Transcript_71687:284-619(+)
MSTPISPCANGHGCAHMPRCVFVQHQPSQHDFTSVAHCSVCMHVCIFVWIQIFKHANILHAYLDVPGAIAAHTSRTLGKEKNHQPLKHASHTFLIAQMRNLFIYTKMSRIN